MRGERHLEPSVHRNLAKRGSGAESGDEKALPLNKRVERRREENPPIG
jgi:hypothetical protein